MPRLNQAPGVWIAVPCHRNGTECDYCHAKIAGGERIIVRVDQQVCGGCSDTLSLRPRISGAWRQVEGAGH